MVEEIFTATPWFSLAAALVFMVVDAVLTMLSQYYYHAGASEVILMQQQGALERAYDPKRGWTQFFTRRIALFLLGGLVSVPLAWYVFTRLNDLPQAFLFGMGGLLLYEAAECIHEGSRVTLFRAAREGEGMVGRVEVARWLVGSLRVAQMYGFSILYLLIFLLTGNLFFLGGAAITFIFGHSTRDVSIYLKLLKRKGR